MKLKTFFISYLLFLSILLIAMLTISTYLMNHQTNTLKEQSRMEFGRITNTISREVDAVYERGSDLAMVELLLASQMRTHANNDVLLVITPVENFDNYLNIAFTTVDNASYVLVTSTIVTTPQIWAISATFDVTNSIAEIRDIQQILLYLFIFFALVAALVLYLLLNKIFKPLVIVTNSAQKIAAGSYGERIVVKGQNEIATMAHHFNQMATEVENRMNQLEAEAIRKQQFMDNLAHELRTPLTTIYGYAEYMQRANLNEQEKIDTTDLIINEADYMKQITNSMLELAKLRHHQVTKTDISIPELFNQITKTLVIAFNQQGISFAVESADTCLFGQVDLIKSLILNLCTNAIKACRSGHGKVVLRAEKTTDKLIISVADNGCGIAPAELGKITEPFYQVDRVRSRVDGSIGLGLTLCQEIANLHGALLIIESEVGAGTVVKVEFTTS